jgi:hypothetical protein
VENLLAHFTEGTKGTVTGKRKGIEVETHLAQDNGAPIEVTTNRAILATPTPGPWSLTYDLGRQVIELIVEPHESFDALLTTTMEGLHWLYQLAAQYGAHPLFQPIFDWNKPLLLADEKRDKLWVKLDGRPALEELTRTAAVQFTIDVHPKDLVAVINRLLESPVSSQSYPNHDNWLRYIARSKATKGRNARYRYDRCGGPSGFEDTLDYVRQLSLHKVVMFREQISNLPSSVLSTAADFRSFEKSVWWPYRARRYSETLTVECRPFPRGHDAAIATTWRQRIKEPLSSLVAL